MDVKIIQEMIGEVFDRITATEDELTFFFHNHPKYRFIQFLHHQDCCESVVIESIVGDLSDLVGSPILVAEEVSDTLPGYTSDDREVDWGYWTFYKFSTIKGSVTVRWVGESNGYYSVDVHTYLDEKEEEEAEE